MNDHAKNLTSYFISDVNYTSRLSHSTSQCDVIVPQHHKAMANLPRYEDKPHRQRIEVFSFTYISILETKHENRDSSSSIMQN